VLRVDRKMTKIRKRMRKQKRSELIARDEGNREKRQGFIKTQGD